MKGKLLLASVLVACAALQGCATKTYGRQGAVTSYERDTLTCREIEIELAKVQGFVEHVNTESQFSGRDVLAILGDFGIGNSLERTAALESANTRSQQLRALRTQRGCTQATTQSPSAQSSAAGEATPPASPSTQQPAALSPAPAPRPLEHYGIQVIGGPR